MNKFKIIIASVLLVSISGCHVTLLNQEAAKQVAKEGSGTSSSTVGARIYQNRCASCHGMDALGSSSAPSLLPIFKQGLTEKNFFELVLRRYDAKSFGLDAAKPQETASVLRQEVVTMPNWEADLVVNSHVNDLYAFLSTLTSGGSGNSSRNH